MIDQPTIDRILDAANIVDVVSEFRDSSETRDQLCRIMPISFGQITVFLRIPLKEYL